MQASNNGVASGFTINAFGGNVHIGNATTGKANLVVNGTGLTCNIGNGTGNTACTSDMRLKKDVEPIADAIEKLKDIRGVSYRWNENTLFEDKQSRHLGVIAQEVRQVFPEAVTKDDDGYLMVGLDALVPPLIEAVKQLKAENEELRGLITASPSQADDGLPNGLRWLDIVLLLGLGGTLFYAYRRRAG